MNEEKNVITFKDESDFFTTVVKEHGNYYVCQCPSCGENEAFIYKSNMYSIKCNRENECGETTKVRFENKIKNYKKPNNAELEKRSEIQRKVTTDFFKSKAFNYPEGFESYRGLEREILNKAGMLYFDKPQTYRDTNVNLIINNSDKYNLAFPFYNKGLVERIVFRSIDDNNFLKEIGMPTSLSERNIDFMKLDLNKDVIIISESILDGLSIKQSYDAGVIAMRGVGKTNQISEWINKNIHKFRDKTFLISLDNDEAGKTRTARLTTLFDDKNIAYINLAATLNKEKDFNELLQKIGREKFSKQIDNYINSSIEQLVSNNENDLAFRQARNHLSVAFESDESSKYINMMTNNVDVGIVNSYLLNNQFENDFFIKKTDGDRYDANAYIFTLKNRIYFYNDNKKLTSIEHATTKQNELINKGEIKTITKSYPVSMTNRVCFSNKMIDFKIDNEKLNSYIENLNLENNESKLKFVESDEIASAYAIKDNLILLNKDLSDEQKVVSVFKALQYMNDTHSEVIDCSSKLILKQLKSLNKITDSYDYKTVETAMKNRNSFMKKLIDSKVISIDVDMSQMQSPKKDLDQNLNNKTMQQSFGRN